jgi:hypothetical protein
VDISNNSGISVSSNSLLVTPTAGGFVITSYTVTLSTSTTATFTINWTGLTNITYTYLVNGSSKTPNSTNYLVGGASTATFSTDVLPDTSYNIILTATNNGSGIAQSTPSFNVITTVAPFDIISSYYTPFDIDISGFSLSLPLNPTGIIYTYTSTIPANQIIYNRITNVAIFCDCKLFTPIKYDKYANVYPKTVWLNGSLDNGSFAPSVSILHLA